MSTISEVERTPWWRVPLIAVALSLLVGVVLLAFSWPAVNAEPKDLPIGIVGSADQIAQVSDAIDDQSDGAITLIEYDDRDEAVAAIEHRSAYGAIVFPSSEGEAPEMLTATAASPVVAQMLQGVAQQQQAQIDATIHSTIETKLAGLQESFAAQMKAALQAVMSGQAPPSPPTEGAAPISIPTITVTVTDIVPLADSDPRGAGLTAAMFPMIIGGMIGGIAITLLVKPGGSRRVVAVVLYAAAAGLVLAGILQGLYGALQGNYGLNAAAIALSIAAISGTITGLAGLIGPAGVGVGAAFTMLIANPISAATTPVEFLPAPWGAIGQGLPPGAAAALLRNLSYFPDADTGLSWLVLGLWAVGGLALTLVDVPGRRLAAGETAAEHPLTV